MPSFIDAKMGDDIQEWTARMEELHRAWEHARRFYTLSGSHPRTVRKVVEEYKIIKDAAGELEALARKYLEKIEG